MSDRWLSGHLVYYEDLERVVRVFVHPLVVELAAAGRISGFFFIRYGLGGPHVRLRLRPARSDDTALVLARMKQAAHQFMERHPSTHRLDEDEIRRGNASTLSTDAHEFDASVYPDNSFHVVPFRPEVERYGGPRRVGASLDFFTLSSVAVLDLLASLGEVGRAVRVTQAAELQLRQALAFAVDEVELTELLRYGVDWFGAERPEVVERGEAVADAKRAFFERLVGEAADAVRSALDRPVDLDASSQRSPRALFIAGARRLSSAVADADRATRLRIGAGQLHMTASRLGLINAEEVFLSRLLGLVVEAVQPTGVIDDVVGPPADGAQGSVRALLQSMLSVLVARSLA